MPPKKMRIDVPDEVSTALAFAANRTCCICCERGKQCHIHHIDGDPSNNELNNLAWLCFGCHDQTQISGGFGRRLNAAQVKRFRDDWHRRVQLRRDKADDLAAAVQAGRSALERGEPVGVSDPSESVDAKLEGSLTAESKLRGSLGHSLEHLPRYIQAIPAIRATAYEAARPVLDTEVTADMMQATYDTIDVLERVLVNLSLFYAQEHFEPNSAEFIRGMIESRFNWHRGHLQPQPGSHGTIIGPITAARVLADVEEMVEDMVDSLGGTIESFDHNAWLAEWRLTENQKLTALAERASVEGSSGHDGV